MTTQAEVHIDPETGRDYQDACPDCWNTGHLHEYEGFQEPIVHVDIPCPTCDGTGWVSQEDKE